MGDSSISSHPPRLLLLDVNALLALGWSTHQFHQKVVARLETRPPQRWATCALTQLGFVRLSSNEAAVGVHKTASEAVALLKALTADRAHVFLASLPSPVAFAGVFDRVLGHQQVMDVYLIGLARHHEASLLTFDQRAEAHGPDAIEVLR